MEYGILVPILTSMIMVSSCGVLSNDDEDSEIRKISGKWETPCEGIAGLVFRKTTYVFTDNTLHSVSSQFLLDPGCINAASTRTVNYKIDYIDTKQEEDLEFSFNLTVVKATSTVHDDASSDNRLESFGYSDWEVGVEKDILNRVGGNGIVPYDSSRVRLEKMFKNETSLCTGKAIDDDMLKERKRPEEKSTLCFTMADPT